MSFLRLLLRRAFALVPDQLVSVLKEETELKRVRYQKSLLKYYGKNFHLAENVIITSPGLVKVGADCAINEFVHILGGGQVILGHGVWIANHASIISVTHPTDVDYIGDHPLITKSITIEDHAWIGAHSVILPGVTLGRSCIIGAGSVVTTNVPPYAIVTGAPARIMRYKSMDNPRLNQTEDVTAS